jgi:hypothetical protein
MLFLLASVPVLAAVLAGSASLDSATRPRSPFVADAPQDPVVVPGDDSNPTGATTPLEPTRGAGGGTSVGVGGARPTPIRREQMPVRVGQTSRVESTKGGTGGTRPVVPGGAATSSAPGMVPRGTPECSTSPATRTPTAAPTSAAPRESGKGGGGLVGIVGGLVGGLLGR